MSSINPYASPQTESTRLAPALDADTIWRRGKFLVLTRNSRDPVRLPGRCVKCNRATDAPPNKLHLSSFPPIAYLGLLMGPLVFLLIAIVSRRRIKVQASLCEQHARIRRKGNLVGWLGSLSMLGLIIVSQWSWPNPWATLCFVGAFLGLLTCIIYGSYQSSILSPKRIRKDLAILKGAGDEFLAQLSEYPGKI